MYGIGKSIRCSVVTYMEGNYLKRGDIGLGIADLLCCAGKTYSNAIMHTYTHNNVYKLHTFIHNVYTLK